MKSHLRIAGKLALAGALTFLTIFNAGCSKNADTESSNDATPPPTQENAAEKAKMQSEMQQSDAQRKEIERTNPPSR